MSDLWAFGRRPSCMVRYRHGGYSAIYPRGNPLLSDETEAYAALTAKSEIAAEAVLEARVEGGNPDNILSFPGGHARKARQAPRTGQVQARTDQHHRPPEGLGPRRRMFG